MTVTEREAYESHIRILTEQVEQEQERAESNGRRAEVLEVHLIDKKAELRAVLDAHSQQERDAAAPEPLYQIMAKAIIARQNCIESNNNEWRDRWEERLTQMESLLPHGAGIGAATINRMSVPDDVWITVFFNHIDCQGYRAGYSLSRIAVKPSLTFGATISALVIDDHSNGLRFEEDTEMGSQADEHFLSYLCEIFEAALSARYRTVKSDNLTGVEYQSCLL